MAKNIVGRMYQRRGTAAEWASKNPVLGAGEIGYDTTNKITKIGDGVTKWAALDMFVTKPKPTFANSSWSDIGEIASLGKAQQYFNVGDEKTIELSTGEEITLQILGFNHDSLVKGGKAPITIGMKHLLATKYPMRETYSSTVSWHMMDLRQITLPSILKQLPYDLQDIIKTVNKKSPSTNLYSTAVVEDYPEKLFLFAEIEITGTQTCASTQDGILEGSQYAYWVGKTQENRIKNLSNGTGEAHNWWLRTVNVESRERGRFAMIRDIGDVYTTGFACNNPIGICFGFCI